MQGDELKSRILAGRPPKATHYRLWKPSRSGDKFYPANGAHLSCDPEFDYPVDCSPGVFHVLYYAGEASQRALQHVGGHAALLVEVSAADTDESTGPAVDSELARVLSKSARPPDPVRSDPGVIATRIETKKRALLRREDRAEARDLARNAASKELLELQVGMRYLRRDNHELTQLITRILSPQADQVERHYALMESGMTSVGIVAEQVKSMAAKLATPAQPVDYTPVLVQIASAFRDIVVVGLQRGDRRDRQLPGEDALAVDAGLKPAADPKLAQATRERDQLRREIERLEKGETTALVHVSAPAIHHRSPGPSAAQAPAAAPRDEKTEAKGMPNGIAQSMAATQYAAHEAQRRSPETTEQGTAAVPMAPTAVVQVNQATHTDVVQGTAGNEHAAQQAQRRSPEATRQGTAEESVQGTAGNEQAEPEAPSQAQPGARAVTDLPKQFATSPTARTTTRRPMTSWCCGRRRCRPCWRDSWCTRGRSTRSAR